MKKVVVDSSGWIELFLEGPKSGKVEDYLHGAHELIVPSLVLFEVYRKVKKALGESKAIYAVTQMQQGETVALDADLALYAADISLAHQLPLADSIVYATACYHQATLVTADNDFRGLPSVQLI